MNRGFGATLGNNKNRDGEEDLDLEEIMNFRPTNAVSPRSPGARGVPDAVQRQYQEDVRDMLDDISMPNQSMTMSNLSQISQSPFRGGGTTPSRQAGFNFQGQQQPWQAPQDSGARLGAYMAQLATSQSQPGLGAPNLNSNYLLGGPEKDRALGLLQPQQTNQHPSNSANERMPQAKTDPMAELDIRELSIEEPRGATQEAQARAEKRGSGSPDFHRQYAENKGEGPKHGTSLNAHHQSNLLGDSGKTQTSRKGIEDQAQLASARSNNAGFRMMIDTTPGRGEAGQGGDAALTKDTQSDAGANKTHNRTFADSVLRQGMLGQKAQFLKGKEAIRGDQSDFEEPRAEDASPLSAMRAQLAQLNCAQDTAASRGATALDPNSFISKADMSAISTLTTAPTKQFRMAMPKTPDRVDSKSLGKHVKKQDSLPDGSAIAGHQKDFARDNGHDEDGVSQLGLSQLQDYQKDFSKALQMNNPLEGDDQPMNGRQSLNLDKSELGALSDISALYPTKSPFVMKFHANNEEDVSQGPVDIQSKHSARAQKKERSSLKVDQELQEAVIDSKPAPESMKDDRIDQGLLRDYQQQETQKLRVELSMLQAQMNKMKITLSEKTEQLKYQESQHSQTLREVVDLKGRIQELQDQNALLQQSKKDHSQLPSFLSRAQDNARKEILTLKHHLEQKDLTISKLSRELDQEQNKDLLEQSGFQQQIATLCAQLDKEKLLSASLKKQAGSNEAHLAEQQEKMRQSYEAEFQDLMGKLHQMEEYVQQIVKEYAEKEAELQTVIKESESVRGQMAEVQRVANVAQEEVVAYKERCLRLEKEVEIKGKPGNGLEQKQMRDMEFEIKQVREQHQKQLAAVKEENRKLQMQLQQTQAQVKAMEADASTESKLQQQEQSVRDLESILGQVRMLVGSEEECDWQTGQPLLGDVQRTVESAEEASILKQEYENMKARSVEQEKLVEEAESQVQKLKRELQVLQRQQSQGPSSFTKNLLLEKDKEILSLKADQSKDKKKIIEIEDKLWHAQREQEILTTKADEGERVLREYEESLKRDRKQADELRAQIQEYEEQISSLKKQLTELEAKSKTQQLQRDTKRDEERQKSQDFENKYLESLQVQQDLEQQLTQLQQQPTAKISAKSKLHSDTNVANVSVYPVEKAILREAGTQCLVPAAEDDRSADEISALRKEIEGLTAELKARAESHETEVAELNAQLEQVAKDRIELENEQVAFDLRCLELEKENKQLAGTVVEKGSALEILTLEQDQLQQQITQLQENEARLLQDLQEAKMARRMEAALGVSSKATTMAKSVQTEDHEERAAADSLQEALDAKEQAIQQLERRIADLDDQIKGYQENEEHFLKEAQILQDTATEELKRRADEIESIRSTLETEIQEKEAAHRHQVDTMTLDFEHKLKEMEKNLVQNELQASLQAQRRQNEERIETLQAQQKEELDRVRKNFEEKIKRVTADADREARQHREEVERIRKQGEERVKRIRVENDQAIKRAELTGQEALATAQQKAKKDLKNAQEKGKSELKNAVDDVKNDMARAKAEWERERKKLLQEHELKLTDAKNEVEDVYEERIRAAKEQSDKMFKKRLQEKEELWQGKFEEIEQEIQASAEEHRQELRNERERQRMELQEVEAGYQAQIEQLAGQLRSQVASEPVATAAPEKPPTAEGECQTDPPAQPREESPRDSKDALKLNEQQMEMMQQEIEQIKEQYNQKLEKAIKNLQMTQETGGSSSSNTQGQAQISHFGKVLRLEFEKILLSLRMKSQNMRQDQLDQKRNEINKQISKIISQDKAGLKRHVDEVKTKISEVLTLFKESLEEKAAKRLKELEDERDSLRKQLNANERSKDEQENKNNDLVPQKQKAQQSKKEGEKAVRTEDSMADGQNNGSADSEDFGILQKLEPQVTNAKGKIVVEVEKVFKDLLVLYRALTAAKFFKLCLATNAKAADFPDERAFNEPASQEQIVRQYRDLQNTIFKLIAKLNHGAESLDRGENEVYRLKLLNQQLKEESWKLKNQRAAKELDQAQVRELLDQIHADQMLMNMLSEQAHTLLGKIQELQPSLEQLLHHQKCLVELFVVKGHADDGEGMLQMNRNCAEINQRCQRYLEDADGGHRASAKEEAAEAYAAESQFNPDDNQQRPALQYNPSPANMGDFTIQNSFLDQQTAADGRSNMQPGHATLQSHASTAQAPSQSPGTVLNLETISQDQAVDLLTKVFQKLNLAPASQPSADRSNHNTQLAAPMHQNWMTSNPANNTEDYIVMNATAPSASLFGAPGGHMAHANVYASQQYQRSAHPMSNLQPVLQKTGADAHEGPNTALDVTNSSHIHMATRQAGLPGANLAGSLDQSNLMDHTLQSAFTTMAAPNLNPMVLPHGNQGAPGTTKGQNMMARTSSGIGSARKTEDCIQQAESLLRMFREGAQFAEGEGGGDGQMRGTKGTDDTSARQGRGGGRRHGEEQNVFASLNLPLQKEQRARMGSTAAAGAVSRTRLATADQTMLSQQQSTTQRGMQLIQGAGATSSNRYAPSQGHNSQLDPHLIDLSSSANFRSLDHGAAALGKTDYNLGSGADRGRRVPPLELKFASNAAHETEGASATHSEYTAGLKENPVILSQQRQPSESKDPGRGLPALNTADEYYKYHKKLRNNKSQIKEERRKSSQVQLQRIEGVVSPISSHKQRGHGGDHQQQYKPQNRYDSIQSAQIELKPPNHAQLHRTNSATSSQLQQQRAQHQFQTVEVHGASSRHHMSKKANVQRPNLPRHANQKLHRKDQPGGTGQPGSTILDSDTSAAFDNHRTLSHHHLDDSVELSQANAGRPGRQDHARAAFLDSTHEASLDELQPSDLQDATASGEHRQWQQQQRGPPKYQSHFQTIQDEAQTIHKQRQDHRSDRHRPQNVNSSSLHRNLTSLDPADADERASQKETIYRHEEEEEAARMAARQRGQRQAEAKAGPTRQGRGQRYEEQDMDEESGSRGAQRQGQRTAWDGDWAGQRKVVERYRSGGRKVEGDESRGQSGYMQARNAAQMKPVKQRRPSRRAASSSDDDY